MIKIKFLTDVIGLAIVDAGAFLYMIIYNENKIVAFFMLLVGNVIGGCLHKCIKK